MRELVHRLVDDRAKILVSVPYAACKETLEIRITPNNPAAAQIVIHWNPNIVGAEMALGKHMIFETIDIVGKRNSPQAIDHVRRILESVIAGNLTEDIWMRGDVVVKSISRLTVDGKEYVFRRGYLFINLFRKTARIIIRYEPY